MLGCFLAAQGDAFEALEPADHVLDAGAASVEDFREEGRKRGQQDQALGRSRGGFSTKIHLKADFDGGPLAFHLTGGEAGDSRHFETLLDIGPDITPRAALGDKGYDAKANRKAARARGICPAIPYKVTAVNRPPAADTCARTTVGWGVAGDHALRDPRAIAVTLWGGTASAVARDRANGARPWSGA